MSEALKKLTAASVMLSAAVEKLDGAAADYIREQVVAYSKAHPRRLVIFCAAMGSTCLHVERGGTRRYDGCTDYQLTAGRCDIGQTPEFLERLADVESEHSIQYALGGPLRIEARGGRVVSELTDW